MGKTLWTLLHIFSPQSHFYWKWMQILTLYIQTLHIYIIHICMYLCTCVYICMYVYVYMKSLMHRCGRNVADQNAHRNDYHNKRLCLVRFQSGARPSLGNVLEAVCVTFCQTLTMSCLFDQGRMCQQWTKLFGRGHFKIVQLPGCGTATAHCSSQIYSKKEQTVKQRIWKMCRLVRN